MKRPPIASPAERARTDAHLRLRAQFRTFLADRLERRGDRPLVIGICGAQGSGKSTLAAELSQELCAQGVAVATLSIDDIYLTRRERQRLARSVHPLLATRGVPGTHDVPLGLSILADIDAGRPVLLPRFDKARDEREPMKRWERVDAPLEALLFEGWCVGARPQPTAALAAPINALEREEDADGTWRRYVNAALAADYQSLFARIDVLALLAVPCWEVVFGWRVEQERALRANGHGHEMMSDDQIAEFIRHYERLTRHILEEMPGRSDVTVTLGEDRTWRHAAWRISSGPGSSQTRR